MTRRPVKILLAASGGGHLRQLLDLESVWSRHPHVFVTTDYALGRSVAVRHRVHFVREYGFGMWHQQRRLAMTWAMLINVCQSVRVVLRERPTLVITTGAAAIFWSILLARLFGARLVSIESFARFEAPSVYGNLVRRFADDLVVQSEKLKAAWPEAHVFDPLRILDTPRPNKEPRVFVTVGALTPFDRMVAAVLAAKGQGLLPEALLVQTGRGSRFAPGALGDTRFTESLDFDSIQAELARADIVVCHGGTGSIITALREGCRVIAMPRQFARGEAFDDHQQEIVTAFAARGLLIAADDADDLPHALAAARAMTPVRATTDPQALRIFLTRVIDELSAPKRPSAARLRRRWPIVPHATPAPPSRQDTPSTANRA